MDEGGTIGISCKVFEGVMVCTKVLRALQLEEAKKRWRGPAPGINTKKLLVNCLDKSEQ